MDLDHAVSASMCTPQPEVTLCGRMTAILLFYSDYGIRYFHFLRTFSFLGNLYPLHIYVYIHPWIYYRSPTKLCISCPVGLSLLFLFVLFIPQHTGFLFHGRTNEKAVLHDVTKIWNHPSLLGFCTLARHQWSSLGKFLSKTIILMVCFLAI